MSPAEQPGQSSPKPQGESPDLIGQADVEKTLNQLESMTSTLVEEVGTAPKPAADPASPPAEPVDSPAREAEAEPSSPAADAPAVLPDVLAGAQIVTASPDAPPAETAGQADHPEAQAEIDREINQALGQLQNGTAKPAAATPAAAPATARPRPAIVQRILRLCLWGLDLVLTPVLFVVILLDMPFRWLPGIVRQLLGYVAIGTALMAGALWGYVLLGGSHSPADNSSHNSHNLQGSQQHQPEPAADGHG